MLAGLYGEEIGIANYIADEYLDDDAPVAVPAGGIASGLGLSVEFQNGPVVEGKRNGAFIEDLLIVAEERLKWYQSGQLVCEENADALKHIQQALSYLGLRRERRQQQGVVNSYANHE